MAHDCVVAQVLFHLNTSGSRSLSSNCLKIMQPVADTLSLTYVKTPLAKSHLILVLLLDPEFSCAAFSETHPASCIVLGNVSMAYNTLFYVVGLIDP